MIRIQELANGTLYVASHDTAFVQEKDLPAWMLYNLNLLRAADASTKLPGIGWHLINGYWLIEPGDDEKSVDMDAVSAVLSTAEELESEYPNRFIHRKETP